MKKLNISDLTLEKYLLKELPVKLIKDIDELVRTDEAIRERLERLQKSNSEIARQYPSQNIIAEIKHRFDAEKEQIHTKPAKTTRYKRFIYPSFAIAAAAVIVIIILPGLNNTYNPENKAQEITRVKGMETKLFIYRKKHNSAELLQNGSAARKGDLLQIAFSSVENPYVVILSIDDRKAVTLHYPKSWDASTKVELNRKILLPDSYELDDAPRYERFFLLTAKYELNADQVLRAAEKFTQDSRHSLTDNLPLEDSVNQISIAINKGETL